MLADNTQLNPVFSQMFQDIREAVGSTQPIEVAYKDNVPEEGTVRGFRLSGAGDKARKQAFHTYTKAYDSTDQEEPNANSRNSIQLAVGKFLHDYIRLKISADPRFKLTHVEGDVTWRGIPGHIDMVLEYQGLKFLVDIKTTGHYSYCNTDPGNPEKGYWRRARCWKGRYYLFNAWSFEDSPFSKKYINQILTYKRAVYKTYGLKVNGVLFYLVSRDTGHQALGVLVTNPEKEIQFLQESAESFREGQKAKSPYDLPQCYENTVGKPLALVCQYCAYRGLCYETRPGAKAPIVTRILTDWPTEQQAKEK